MAHNRVDRYSFSLAGAAFLLVLLAPPPCWAAEPLAGGAVAPALLNTGQETVSLASSALKAFGSLVLVIGIMLLLMKGLRKIGLHKGAMGTGNLINVLDTRMIAPKKQLAVIEVAGECVLVGITDQRISLLTRLENPENLLESRGKDKTAAATRPSSFAALLGKTIQGNKKPHQPEQPQ